MSKVQRAQPAAAGGNNRAAISPAMASAGRTDRRSLVAGVSALALAVAGALLPASPSALLTASLLRLGLAASLAIAVPAAHALADSVIDGTDEIVDGSGDGTTGTIDSPWVVSGDDHIPGRYDLHVGFEQDASLTIRNGGVVESHRGFIGTSEIGLTGGAVATGNPGVHGTVTVTGPDSIWALDLDVSGTLRVGSYRSHGTLLIEDGGKVVSDISYVGWQSVPDGGTGTATVTGNDSAWELGYLWVGGDGELLVAAGGRVEADSDINSSSGVYIGPDSFDYAGTGPTGVVTVTGAGSTFLVDGTVGIRVGRMAKGVLTVADGGTVTANNILIGGVGDTGGGGGRGVINIGAAEGEDPVAPGFLNLVNGIAFGESGWGGDSWNYGRGTLVFNHTSTGYDFSTPLVVQNAGSHQIRVLAGTTNLLADYSTFTGTTHVNGGTLFVADKLGGNVAVDGGLFVLGDGALAGAATLGNGGILGGTGTFGAVTVGTGGVIAPGTSPGTLTMASLNMQPGAVLEYELGAPGTIGGGVNDLIVVNGAATLNGTVNVTALPGFDAGTYTLMQYASVTDDGLALGTAPAGYTYTLDAGGTALTLAVLSGGGPGWQYWDGANAVSGTLEGGSGDWTSGADNWAASDGTGNAVWGDQVAVFGGPAGGDVDVIGTHNFTGLRFETNGYTLWNGALGAGLVADAAGADIFVGNGTEAAIRMFHGVSGGPITKTGNGTLVLGGGEIVSPFTAAETWTVDAGELVIDGRFEADEWDNDTAVILRSGSTLTVTENGSIGAQTALDTFISIEGQGRVSIEEGGLATAYISGTASDSTVTIAGTLGSVTRGSVVDLTGARNFVEVTETGEINTPQGTTIGIGVTGDDNSIVMNGAIRGLTPRAIRIVGNTNTASVGGTIETTGFASGSRVPVGVAVSGDDNAITIENGGTVRTLGEGSPAIATTGTHNQVTVSGVVTTEGGVEEFFGYGGSNAIRMNGSNNVLEITDTGNVFVTHADVAAITLVGDSSTMTLSGTVAAASASETAILFDGGSASSSNTLELQPGYSITGIVVGDTDAAVNDLVFGGDSGSATFDLSSLGTAEQFRNFNRFSKDGDATWTLEGTHAFDAGVLNTPFYFRGGTLLVNGELRLGSRLENNGIATLGGNGRIAALQATSGLTIAPGGITPGSEIGTLSIDVLALHADTVLDFDLGPAGAGFVGGTNNDLIDVRYDLTLDGVLNVTDAGGFGNGEYTLIQYGNLIADNGLDIGTMPDPNLTYVVTAGTPLSGSGEVILTVSGGTAGDNQYWDGPNAGTAGVQGGDGFWNGVNDNWTNQAGTANAVWGGQFAIFRGTAGDVTVQGSQTFTGMQFLTSDYHIVADAGAQLVAGLAETTVQVGTGLVTRISAPITGTGGIVKQGGGDLRLGGPNVYSGATVVNGGSLTAILPGTFSANSAHVVAAGAVLDLNNGNQTIASLAGEGRVLLGSATLTAGGNNTSTTFSGVMEGSGGLTKTGSGILTLTGENTYTGTTTIAQGTLSLGDGGSSGSVAGNIVNNNNFLVFNRSDEVTYAGILSGTGSTSFIGSGMTTLTGDSSGLTGPAFVTDGNLRIASGGSLGSSLLTVGADGTLSGFGTIVGNVNVDGRLAPGGDTLGTFTITGDVAFQTGSTYAIRIAGTNPDPSPAATIDSLIVGGMADLTDGTVEIAAIDPRTSYVDGHTYATPILSATGGLGATEFAGVGMTSDSAFITPTLSYVGNDVFLTIAVTQDFSTAAETYNQFQAASALNDLEQTGDALAVFNTIANMNADDARRAFDLTSGEVHAAGQHVIDQTFALFNRTLRYQGVAGVGSGNVGAQVFTAPLGYGPAVAAGNAGVVAIEDAAAYADARVRGAWAAPLGGFGHVDSDGNAAKLDWWNAGLAGGYEGVIDVASGNAVGGFGFGYIHSRGTLDDRLSTFDADGFYLGAYGAWADGPWNVAGSLSYGANRVSTERNIAFMGTTAEASYWTHTIGASGEASYAFDLADTTKLAPLFTLDAGWSGHGGFTETGAGALNLTSGSESWTRLDAGLGIALTHTILTENGNVTLEGRAVWEHAFADVVPSQSLALAGSPTGFTVLGPDAGRDRLRIGAGLSWDVSDDMTVRARYDGLFSNSQANHSASIGLNIRF